MTRKEMRIILAELGLSQAKLAAIIERSEFYTTDHAKKDALPFDMRFFLRVAQHLGIQKAKEMAR